MSKHLSQMSKGEHCEPMLDGANKEPPLKRNNSVPFQTSFQFFDMENNRAFILIQNKDV